MIWKKRAHQSTNFQTFESSNESSPNSSCHSKTTNSGFIPVLHQCSVSWKITPLYLRRSNLVYFGQKERIEKKCWDFWVVEWKLTKLLMSRLKPQVSFSLTFASLFSVVGDNSSTLLAEILYDLGKRKKLLLKN